MCSKHHAEALFIPVEREKIKGEKPKFGSAASFPVGRLREMGIVRGEPA